MLSESGLPVECPSGYVNRRIWLLVVSDLWLASMSRTPPTTIMPRLSSPQRGSRPYQPVWILCLLFVLGAASQGFQSQPWDLVVVTATTTIDVFTTVTASDNAATSPSPSSSTEVTGDLGVVATTTVTIWVESVGSETWDDSTSTGMDTEPSLGTTHNSHPEAVTSTVIVEFSTSTTITTDPWPAAADGQSPSLSTAATAQNPASPGDATDWMSTLDTLTSATSTSPSTTAFAAPGGESASGSSSPSGTLSTTLFPPTPDPSQAASEHGSSRQPTEPWIFPNSTSSLPVQGSIGSTPAAVSQGTTATIDSAQEQTASILPDGPLTPPSAGSILASVHNLTSAVATADLQSTAVSSASVTSSDDAADPVVSAAAPSDGSKVTQSSSNVSSSFSAASSGSFTSETWSQTETTQVEDSQASSKSQQPGSAESTFIFPSMPTAAESRASKPTGSSQRITTEGQTGTSNDATPSTSAVSTEATSTTEGVLQLPTFNVWPPEATIMPLDWEVEAPEPLDDVEDAAVVPCKLWFFFVCIIFDRVKILGWLFVLPPGIYPPGPPPFPVFKFPPELHFQGTLPPWPQFTVGPDHVPTFPREPDPTECLTKTASLCSATTSFVVSTADEQVRTISTYAPEPTCGELLGCQVADKTAEATATRTEDECMTSTVTDVTFTCSGTAASDCFTYTAKPKTGCSVTATTTSIQCTTATAEAGHARDRRQAPGPADGANIPMCPNVRDWIVWPEDGENRRQTQAIYKALLDHVGNRPAAIETAASKNLGISYWRVNMTQGQAEGARSIPNVAVVFTTCKDKCPDPSTQDWHFRYRFQGKYSRRPHVIEGEAYSRRQMDFLSEEDISGSANFAYGVYVFDNSSGVDVPVYIVDTGANLDHPEFAEIRHKVEFLHARPDYDGTYGRDDGGLPRNQSCPAHRKCNPHGTSMLAAVAGASLGSAKRVTPVMARVRRGQEGGGGNCPLDYLDALVAVADVYANAPLRPAETKGVVNLSWEYSETLFQLATNFAGDVAWWCWRKRLGAVIREIVDKGLLVVIGAGNEMEYNAWPALFAAKESEVGASLKHPDRPWIYIPEILVVGALYPSTGAMSERSAILPWGNVPHVWAPGVDLLMAVGSRDRWELGELYEAEAQGTSFACAYTSGIAAYFIRLQQLNWLPPDEQGRGLGETWPPLTLKDYIIRMAWARVPLDPILGRRVLGVWNGVRHVDVHGRGYCRWDPSVPGLDQKQKRLRFHPRPRQAAEPLLTSSRPQCREGVPDAATSAGGSISFATATTPSPSSVVTLDPSSSSSLPLPPLSSTATAATALPPSSSFVCTNATADQCAPAVVCHAPAHNGCDGAGRCVCLLPDDPAPHVTDLRLYPRSCNRWTSAATEDGPTRATYVRAFAALACWRGGDYYYDVRPSDNSTSVAVVALDGRDPDGRPYSVDVFWMQGCRLPGGEADQVQDLYVPLARRAAEEDDDVSCPTLLFENWSMCDGGRGRGGSVQAGCLVYRLVPTRLEAAQSPWG